MWWIPVVVIVALLVFGLAITIIDSQDVRMTEDARGLGDCPVLSSEEISKYMKSVIRKYSRMKTLIYSEKPKPIGKFDVCSDVRFCPRNTARKKHLYDDFPPAAALQSFAEMTTFGEMQFDGYPRIQNPTAIKLRDEFGGFLLLTGTGGLGKSMMMKHLLLDAAANYET